MKIKIILYTIGREPVVKEIENELQPMQDIVGGHIETFTQPDGIILICNEEGKLMSMTYNRTMFGEPIMGNFFLCRVDSDGECASVTDEDIKRFII